MKESEKFMPINTDEIEWQDGEKILGLPPGLKAKIIAEAYDEVSERVDKFVQFPPGYTEPRHEHDYYHSTLVLEGEMHVAGKCSSGATTFMAAARETGTVHTTTLSAAWCIRLAVRKK